MSGDWTRDPISAIEHQDPRVLASHYTWRKRAVEVVSIAVFCVLVTWMVARLWRHASLDHLWLLGAAFVVSMIAADFVSGFVHWLADTWGTVEYPIVGPTLIKNFREHHVDPLAITRHDLIETNGDNCMVLVPAQALSLLMPLEGGHPVWLFLFAFMTSFTFWIMMTNQVHKWAHLEPGALSWPVRLLQRTRLILPKRIHDIHHTPPYERHYCITNGWMNPLLNRIGFFRRLERVIHRVTGAIPRENDIGTKAAAAVAVQLGVLAPGYVPARDLAPQHDRDLGVTAETSRDAAGTPPGA